LALIKKYLDKNKITFPVAVGKEGFSFDNYAIKTIPTMIIVDRSGNVIQIKSGTATTCKSGTKSNPYWRKNNGKN